MEREYDVVIIGGGTGGVAAALAAARNGKRVVMTEETDWIGGQLTQQAVPPDENPWVESFDGTQSYLGYRAHVRDYYRRNYPLTGSARSRVDLNPGNAGVSRICHEPKVSLAVLTELLACYTSTGQVTVLLDTKSKSADVEGDHVRAITVESTKSGDEVTLTGAYFVDATETGELLPLTGTEYATGFESQKDTGEPHAPSEYQPQNMQSFTCCFAMDHLEGEDHTIEKPEMYDFWKSYVPELAPAWPGPILDWAYTHPISLEPNVRTIHPEGISGPKDGLSTGRILSRGRLLAISAW